MVLCIPPALTHVQGKRGVLYWFGAGVSLSDGRTLHLVFVGTVGDLPFQAKIWKHARHFNRKDCCPWCNVTRDNIGDVGDVPTWWLEPVVEPWDAPGPIARIPGFGRNLARHDVFHLGPLGVSRHFYSSTIVLLCQFFMHFQALGSRALEARLAVAYAAFKEYCKMNHKSPLVKEFTPENFHYSSSTYPDTSFKAADSQLLMGFLQDYLDRPWAFDTDGVMDSMLNAATAYNCFYRLIWTTGDRVWLSRTEARQAAAFLDRFVRSYALLASWSLRQGFCHYVLVPKLHYLKHVVLSLRLALADDNINRILSPALMATPEGEDFIGRISRPVRALPSVTAPLRRLQLYRVELYKAWHST